MFGSIRVMFGLVAGNEGAADNTFGKTGAPGCVGANCATMYLLPSHCKAFDVARNGIRSK